MIGITVKTIDSNNYEFSVEENITVKEFKELIASKVNITPDLQRLIFCGRVLSDDKHLKDYDINDGKVVHLVRRAPPMASNSRSGSAPNSSESSPRHNNRRSSFRTVNRNDDNSYLLGAFSIPQEAFNPNSFQQMLQNVVSNMGDIGRNATVMSRTSEDGSSVDVQINLAQMPPQNEALQRINQAKRFIGYINAIIDVIERPDSIPGVGLIETDSNITNTNIFVESNGSQSSSLESQLASHTAQSIAAASNAFDQIGIPLVSGSQIIIGSSSNRSETQSNSSFRIAQPVIIQTQTTNITANRTSDTTNTNNNNNTNDNNNNDNNSNTNRSNSTRNTNSDSNNANNSSTVASSEVNNLFNSVFQTQERLRPHIQRYQQLVSSEGVLTEQQSSEAQILQRNCMRATHHLAHVFHLISDLSINFNQSTRPVGVVQTLIPHTSMESVSVSVPFTARQRNAETDSRTSSTPSETTNSSTASAQLASDVAATAGSTTTSTNSVPRFSQSNSGGQSNSVFVAQSPIVVMEVGSTVERIPISSNGQRNESNPNNGSTPPTTTPRPLFIPPTFDPFLQCNSPFTIPEIRTRVSVGITSGRNPRQPYRRQTNNNNNNNNNNTTGNSNANNQTTSQAFASLGQIVNGILNGFLGQQNVSEPTPNPANVEPSVNVDPTLIDLMGRLNSERPSTEQIPVTNMTDMFMSFVNGILQIINGGQTNSINVAHFLHQLDGFSYVEGENIANDIFMVMARVLSFQDLFHIFAGNSQPLNRVREPLREFVHSSVLNGNEPNRENIDHAIERLINSWRPGLMAMTSGLSIMPGINSLATIEHFLRFNLNRIFTFFLFPPELDYGNAFFTLTREILNDMISLSQVCFTDGVLALQRMVASFITHVSSELNPAIQEWMRSVAIRHLNDYINNNNTAQSQNSETYIIRNDNEANIDSNNASNNEMEQNNHLNEESLEVENVEFSDALSELEDALNSNNSSINMETSYNELPAVVIGTESWHSSVPRDWVPIITNDLGRQRRLPIQRPFSDGYLNGMPKKRKIERRSINIRDSLRNALTASGVRPLSSLSPEQIANEMTMNSSLINSFDELIRFSVNQRISNDEDYINARATNPERFNNSKNYFTSK